MENIIIRNIKKDDIPEVVDIQINSWKASYKGIIDDKYLESMNREEKIRKREQDYTQDGFIVAELNGKIVGFCRYLDKKLKDIDCEIKALYVKPELKHKGIGTKMFNYVKQEFKSRNKKKMIICCLKENFPSRIFYEKMGGKIIEETTITIGDKDYKEVCFCYDI